MCRHLPKIIIPYCHQMPCIISSFTLPREITLPKIFSITMKTCKKLTLLFYHWYGYIYSLGDIQQSFFTTYIVP